MSYRGHDLVLIDTAGIRRPGQVQRGIEKYSVIRAVGAVDRCDIALIIIDASELATAQDTHIAGLAWEMGRGVIVVVNKWDLRDEQGRYARAETEAFVRERLHFMSYVPVRFTSALLRQGIGGLMDTAMELWDERRRIVANRDLQFMLADAMSEHSPPLVKRNRGVRARINRVRQVGINPPTFLFTVNDTRLIHYTYRRYLENRIRDAFGFDSTHLRLVFRRE
jgi:GTP-binding protein